MEKKILIAIGIATVLVLAISLGFRITSEKKLISSPPTVPTPSQLSVVAEEGEGILSFHLAERQYRVGEIIPVSILADVKNQPLIGADLFVRYDSDILEPQANNEGKLVKSSEDLFPVFPAHDQEDKGIIKFSVLSNTAKMNQIELATLYFLAKKAGQAKLEFLFERYKTSDTNLVSVEGKDILASVGEVVFQIIK